MTKHHKKKLVIVNQDVGYLFIDLANAALADYDEVVLLAGSVIEFGSSLDEKVVSRRIVRYRRQSMISRAVTWVLGIVQIFWLLLTKYRRHEVLLSSNPPLTSLLPLILRRKMGLYVLDHYPEALHKTGMVRENHPIVKIWGWLNRKAYPRFSAIWTLTPSMKRAIESGYGVTVTHIPAWASERNGDTNPAFLAQNGLENAWIVLYSGNIGREHDVECLLECAARMREAENLRFVIAGEGWKKKMLADRIAAENLQNAVLLPKLPGPDFAALLDHTKIGVVTQSPRTADVSIPSKTFNLLAAGLPILGIGRPNSDFGDLIGSSGSGQVFTSGQIDEMCAFIRDCRDDPAKAASFPENARKTALSFTRANAEKLVRAFSGGAAG